MMTDIEPLRSKRCDSKSISQTAVSLKHCSEACYSEQSTHRLQRLPRI